MPRPNRIVCPNMHYHIIMRGNNQEKIFIDDNDRNTFLKILVKFRDKFNLKIYAYALMDNHIHLFIKTIEPNLSKAMKMINWSYAIYFNRKYKRKGHLFQSRFTAKTVTDEKYFFSVIRYIHLNPVKANIVKHPSQYKWSSYNSYIQKENEILNDISEMLLLFDLDERKAIRKYIEFMNSNIPEKEFLILNRIRNENLSFKLGKLHGDKNKKDFNKIICKIIRTDLISWKEYKDLYYTICSLKE